MAKTSLFEQLRKLHVPQTSFGVESRKKTSLLFDAKEAANYDKDTVYSIGLSGLKELIEINPRFKEFKENLFNETSVTFERAVENKETNKKLDKVIQKFLFLLSPYVLLKPARLALEWLISRYHIHQYNTEDFLFLVLPYHETKTFSDVLQVLPVEKETSKFHWLHLTKKKNVPLSKSTIYNRCATDLGFLELICSNTKKAIKTFGQDAHQLTTLFAFYATSIVGTLEHCDTISEKLVTAIVPSVIDGLQSSILDYVSASFIIIARFITKTSLNQEVLIEFVNLISKVNHAKLQSDAILLLILIYQLDSVDINESKIPKPALMNITNSWRRFVNCLSNVSRSGAHCTPFVVPLVRSLITCITNEKSEDKTAKDFIDLLLLKAIVFDTNDATVVISTIFKSANLKKSSKHSEKWVCNLLKRLEKGYPTAWDAAIKSLDSSSFDNASLRSLMGISSTTPNSDLFEKLMHPNSKVRLEAVLFLLTYGTPEKIESVKDALANCFNDDDLLVVKAMLSAPPKVLSKLLTQKHALLLLERFWLQWNEHLDLEIIDQLDLVVNTLNDITVRTSHLLFQFRYSKEENTEFNSVWGQFIIANGFETVCDHILDTAIALPPDLAGKPLYIFWYSHLLSLLLKDDKVAGKKLDLFNSISQHYLNSNKVKFVTSELNLDRNNLLACLKLTQKGQLPLEGLLNFINVAVSGSLNSQESFKQEDWLKRDVDENFSLLFATFKVILLGCSEKKDKELKSGYNSALTYFIKSFWPSNFQGKLNFICAAIVNSGEENPAFLLQCVTMMKDFIQSSKEKCNWALDLDRTNFIIPVLLTLLSNPSDNLRTATIDCLELFVKSSGVEAAGKGKSTYHHLLTQIVERCDEIRLDKNQICLILFSLLSPDADVQSLLPAGFTAPLMSSLDCLIEVILSGVSFSFVYKLLSLLSLVNSEEMTLKLVPLADSLMTSLKTSMVDQRKVISHCLIELIKRLNVLTANCLKSPVVWKLVKDILASQTSNIYLEDDSSTTSVCVLFLKQVTPDFYAALPSEIQDELLSVLVNVSANSENPEVVSAVASVFKHISIDSSVVSKILVQMRDATTPIPQNVTPLQKRRIMNSLSGSDFIETLEWKRGIALLELIQNKRKLHSSHILVPVLFDLLKKCLQFEEQSSVEYIKQLCLTCILHSYEKILETQLTSKNPSLSDTNMDFSEVIVECIRGTQNPQTHHHALLVLTKMAILFPKQVVHNVMPLFTFIGSSVLRQDDSYSFQIIFKIIETVIPVLLQASNKHEMAISILRVFSSALLDIPEHRRLSLLIKLHETLEESEYLWIFLAFVLESYVLHHSANKSDDVTMDSIPKSSKESKHLKYLEELCAELPSHIVIRNFNHLFTYILALPHTKSDKTLADYQSSLRNKRMIDVFNFVKASDKELRHFKYKTVLFISSFISRQDFVQQVSSFSMSSSKETKSYLQTFLQHVLSFIQLIPEQILINAKNKSLSKYWDAMLTQCHDVLAKITTMLPKDLFLDVISSLLNHEKVALRCKALELLNASLQKYSIRVDENNEDRFEEKDLLELLPKLVSILKTIEKTNRPGHNEGENSDSTLCQQECCISLKLLARHLASNNPNSFIKILELTCNYICNENVKGVVAANLILCFAELMFCLRSKAIVFLPKFMPVLISHLSNDSVSKGDDIFLTSIVSATNKIMDAVPLFLSLDNISAILSKTCLISLQCKNQLESNKLTILSVKLKAIRQKLANEIPERILYPAVNNCYSDLCEWQCYDGIEILMSILSDKFQSNVTSTDELNSFFMKTFEFRSQYHAKLNEETISRVENSIINTFVALVLKYSEPVFRTLFYKILDWGINSNTDKLNVIIFFKITHALSQRLQALFTSLANSLFKPSVKYLNETNVAKVGGDNADDLSGLFFESDAEKSVLLLEEVLKALLSIFTFDLYRFASKERFERFEILIQPLVDQLENCIGNWEERCADLLTPCIAQMAVSAGDDNLWKPLNYQILLKTQHGNPKVRQAAVKTMCAVAVKLGDDFVPLLPETVQFLAELLEDDDESVEKCCKKVIQTLEKSLGEPISELF